MTRSFSAIANGNIRQAFEYNFAAPVLFAFIIFQACYRIAALWKSPRKVNRKLKKVNIILAAITAAAILVNWLFYIGGRLL